MADQPSQGRPSQRRPSQTRASQRRASQRRAPHARSPHAQPPAVQPPPVQPSPDRTPEARTPPAQSPPDQPSPAWTPESRTTPTQSPAVQPPPARTAPDRTPEAGTAPDRTPEAEFDAGAGDGAGGGAAGAAEGDPPEQRSGLGLWSSHSAELARATAIDLAVLAGHLLLYPTGIFPERTPGPPAAMNPADGERLPGLPDPAGPPAEGAPAEGTPAEGLAHPPVVLLHGFVDNRSAFALLRRSLLRHGWPRVQALNYSPLTCDIRAAAELLGPHIEQVCERSGHRRVDIVAHSLGGLIARYYVQCLGGDLRVRTLVTLGTPHSGTRAVPALLPHPLARQMRPGSAVLEELAGPAPGCRTRFVAFWSDLDQLMMPVGSARLEHPDLPARNVKVSGIGHLALPVHGAVATEIRRALAEEAPRQDPRDAA